MKFLFILTILFIATTIGDSILCYDCVYCNDPFEHKSEYVRTCNGTFCSKSTRFYENDKKPVVLARSCESNVTIKLPSSYWKMHYCDTDFCNSATSPIIATSILLTSILIQLIIPR